MIYDRGPVRENYQIVANVQRNVNASLRKGTKLMNTKNDNKWCLQCGWKWFIDDLYNVDVNCLLVITDYCTRILMIPISRDITLISVTGMNVLTILQFEC